VWRFKFDGTKILYVNLEIRKTEKGLRIQIQTEEKAAVLIKDNGKERILLPINETVSENTYYYENSSGLSKTEEGYVGFYHGNPDEVQVLN